MATQITLKDVKVGMQDDLYPRVIDEFTKNDYLFNTIPFEFIANKVLHGAGWTVTYTKVKEESKTQFRDINGVYTDTFSTREEKTVSTKVFGGSYSIDRALKDQGGVELEIEYQLKQLIKSAKKTFSYYLINGAVATNQNQFDGLNVLLKGSKTDINANGTGIDLSTFDLMKENALKFVNVLDEFLAKLGEKPDVLLGNSTLINKIKTVCKIVGINTMTQNNVGEMVDQYNGIRLQVLETANIDGEQKETIPTDNITKETELYAVSFGGDGLVLASPNSGKAIETILPDFTQAKEQVRGLLELRAVPLLRNSMTCGVLRKIKVGG